MNKICLALVCVATICVGGHPALAETAGKKKVHPAAVGTTKGNDAHHVGSSGTHTSGAHTQPVTGAKSGLAAGEQSDASAKH